MKTLTNRLKSNELQLAFATTQKISRAALKQFYQQFDPGLKETTFRWMLYELKKQNLLLAIDRGVFKLCEGPVLPEYSPLLSKNLQTLSKKIKAQFPYVGYCLWETSCLNEFLLHQTGKTLIIIEVEADAAEAVFYHLKENRRNVYLTPTPQEFERYVYSSPDSIVIKKLVSQSPLLHQQGIPTPKLEKLIVDLFTDTEFYYPYQGKERTMLFQNVFERYRLSLKTLYRYAERRKCRQPLEDYLQTQIFPAFVSEENAP